MQIVIGHKGSHRRVMQLKVHFQTHVGHVDHKNRTKFMIFLLYVIIGTKVANGLQS